MGSRLHRRFSRAFVSALALTFLGHGAQACQVISRPLDHSSHYLQLRIDGEITRTRSQEGDQGYLCTFRAEVLRVAWARSAPSLSPGRRIDVALPCTPLERPPRLCGSGLPVPMHMFAPGARVEGGLKANLDGVFYMYGETFRGL